MCRTILEFIGNRAVILGDAVYIATFSTEFDTILSECLRKNLSKHDVGSAAANITVLNLKDNYLSIFPGQNIILNISITDHYGKPSLCTASVSLLCNEKIYNCFDLYDNHFKLSGPDSVVLVQPPHTNI